MHLKQNVERLEGVIRENENTIATLQVDQGGKLAPVKKGSKAERDVTKDLAVLQQKYNNREAEVVNARKEAEEANTELDLIRKKLEEMEAAALALPVAEVGGKQQQPQQQVVVTVSAAAPERSPEEVHAMASAPLDGAGEDEASLDKVTLQFKLLQEELVRSEEAREQLAAREALAQEQTSEAHGAQEEWREKLEEVEEELKEALQKGTDLEAKLAALQGGNAANQAMASDIEKQAASALAVAREASEAENAKLKEQAEREAERIKGEASQEAMKIEQEANSLRVKASDRDNEQLDEMEARLEEATATFTEQLDDRDNQIGQLKVTLGPHSHTCGGMCIRILFAPSLATHAWVQGVVSSATVLTFVDLHFRCSWKRRQSKQRHHAA